MSATNSAFPSGQNEGVLRCPEPGDESHPFSMIGKKLCILFEMRIEYLLDNLAIYCE